MRKVLYVSLAMAVSMVACKSGQEPIQETAEIQEATVLVNETDTDVDPEEKAEDFAQVNEDGFYGETFDIEGAITLDQAMVEIADKDSLVVKVRGEVNGVCQVKGCWMTMNSGDQDMRVKFKDYAFFVPKGCSGKVAYVDGVMRREEVSVADQKHLLEDAEASKKEIDAVTEPKQELSFTASGVKLQ